MSLQKSTEYAIVINCSQTIDDFDSRISHAHRYDFELDSFQKHAIVHLEARDNVMVAAHTSAGKTVVAEYAIAMSQRNGSRVIYTSPIKALSNQKYRDFNMTFTDVGIITGDVQIKPEASCLIMTTEILLKMLYNSNDIIHDLEWVIFDEVHYVNDPERGHVWEEVFILLPSHINLVLLSATVPNYVEFADWLGRTRQRKTYVVSTLRRPVPLEHFLYTGSNGKTMDERFMIVDQNGTFLVKGFKEADEKKKERQSKHDRSYGAKVRHNVAPHTEKNIYISVIRHLIKFEKLPVICFTLSKKRCDYNAKTLMEIETLALTNAAECAKIHKFVAKHINRLKETDRKVPQVMSFITMLKRGYGVHHSGILPILKEITEILFSEGLVKVLFATETFAMGVNMPARTVIFDSITKNDGHNFRDLRPSEYIQMAGRAGRRGKDETGTVIILCKADVPDMATVQQMILGRASELESQFRLTYSLALNLSRLPDDDTNRIEKVLRKSFVEHKSVTQVLDRTKKMNLIEAKIKEIPLIECETCTVDIDMFCTEFIDYQNLCHNIMPKICKTANEKKLLNSGRIIVAAGKSNPYELAIVLHVKPERDDVILTILALTGIEDRYEYIRIMSKDVHSILKVKMNPDSIQIMRENDRNDDVKESTEKCVNELRALGLGSSSALLYADHIDPIKDLDLRTLDFVNQLDAIRSKCDRLISSYKCTNCDNFLINYRSAYEKANLRNESNAIKKLLSDESLQFLPEYFARINVLKEMNYINDDGVLELKGKVACVMSDHELVITELIMDNLLNDLNPEDIAALLSAFVFQEKSDNEPKIPEVFGNRIEKIKEFATTIAKLQIECGIKNEPVADFVESINFGLVEVVHEWAKGMAFAKLMELTDVAEGTIVRCIQRLDELLKNVISAAKLIGNPELAEKVEKASELIRRDIVFAPSLYVQNDIDYVEDDEDD